MSVKHESHPEAADNPLPLHFPMWPFYIISLLFIAYPVVGLVLVVSSCSISQFDSAAPSPAYETIEAPMTAPVPDEGRAP